MLGVHKRSTHLAEYGDLGRTPLFIDTVCTVIKCFRRLEEINNRKSKKISNDQELIQSDPISCPQNQKGNN